MQPDGNDHEHVGRRPLESPATSVWNAQAERWRQTDLQLGDEDNDRVAELLGAVTGCRVLDAGCGARRRARALAGTGAQVVGIDIAPDMLRLAGEAVAESQHLVRADVTHLPFGDGAFDAALAAYVPRLHG